MSKEKDDAGQDDDYPQPFEVDETSPAFLAAKMDMDKDDSSHPGKQKSRGEYHGADLYEKTKIRPLELRDLEREDGVRDLYTKLMLKPSVVVDLCGVRNHPTFVTYPTSRPEDRKDGFLFPWNKKSIHMLDPGEATDSIAEEMMRLLQVTERADGGDVVRVQNGTTERLHWLLRGSVLVSNDESEKVLAFITWIESQMKEAKKRCHSVCAATWSVHNLFARKHSPLGRTIRLNDMQEENRNKYQQAAGTTIQFDTIGADPDVRGAAGYLFADQVPKWRESGHESIILYRHTQMNMFNRNNLTESIGTGVAQDNLQSYLFFHNRKLGSIGTRRSRHAAPWKISGAQWAIQPEQGWMRGDLKEVEKTSAAIAEAARRKFVDRL